MNKYLVVILLIGLSQFNSFSQEQINNYKYIIVPMQYEFQNSDDEYQINSLLKFLFNKYGYNALLESEDFPNDLAINHCLGLKANVSEVKGGFLVTKVQIDLVDCQNQVIVSSVIGKTKEKAYKTAYNLAIREAFTTFQNFSYKYSPNRENITLAVSESTSQEMEIERLKKEVESLKEKTEDAAIKESETSAHSEATIATKTASAYALEDNKSDKNVLYAQAIDGGFQIVDDEPKTVMILLHSGLEGNFIVKGKDAMVYKKGTTWIYTEHDGKTLKTKEIHLKF